MAFFDMDQKKFFMGGHYTEGGTNAALNTIFISNISNVRFIVK